MKTEPGTRDELMNNTSELGVVEDAVQVFIAREQVALNSYLPDDMCANLRGELFGAMLNGTECAVEVIQRYHALVSLLKAVAKHDKGTQATTEVCRAAIAAEGYGWEVQWSKFNTRVERIQ